MATKKSAVGAAVKQEIHLKELLGSIELEKPPAASPEAPPQDELKKMLAEPRMTTLLRGAKMGMMKEALKKFVSAAADPIKEKILPTLHASFPGGGEFLDEAVELALSVIIVLGSAEMIAMVGPMAAGMMGEEKKGSIEERSQMIAKFMREYAGELAGAKLVDAAMAAFPLILGYFADFSNEDLKLATEQPVEEAVQEAV